MKRWPTLPLGEVAQVTAGDPAPQRPEDFSDNGVPFVRMQDVGRYGQTTCLAETKDHLSASASAKLKRFPSGTILVPKSGASIRLNHRAILGIEAHVVSHLAAIIPHKSLNTRFAYYWLCATDLSGVAHQADLPSMKTSDLAKLQLPIPPLAEQERIVKLLDEANELRKLRAQTDHLTVPLIPALFHEMFGDPFSNSKGWPEFSLSESAERIVDCPHTTPHWQPNGVVCVRTSNLGVGSWVWTDRRYVAEAEYKDRTRRSELIAGDIVLSREGTVGVAAIVPDGLRLCLGQRLVQVRPKAAAMDSEFLLQVLLEELAPVNIEIKMAGSTSKHFNVKQLRALEVIAPPLSLQKEFAIRVSEIRELKTKQTASRERLDDLFQSMLHRAFNGEL